MNMIQKMYDCVLPVSTGFGFGDVVREYQVSAWMAMGSDSVMIRLRDGLGWYQYIPVQVEKLSDYAMLGIRTMDELIEHLFWVVPS